MKKLHISTEKPCFYKKRKKEYSTKQLVESGISLVLCLTVLILCVFAWFTQSKTLESKQAELAAMDIASIRVTAKSGATVPEALTVAEVESETDLERLFTLSVDSEAEKISPGISGNFTAYVTVSGTSKVSVTPTVCAGRVSVEDVNGVGTLTKTDGLRADVGETEAQRAKNYMQGHILLFTGFDANTGVYSGWLDPFSPTDIDLTGYIKNSASEYELKFYWIWIDSYSKLCDDGGLIDSASLTAIREKFFDNPDNEFEYNTLAGSHLFDKRSNDSAVSSKTVLNHFFDFADEDIGLAIMHLYFDILFTT